MVNDPNERWLIDQLRKEASDLKSCFTNFSFQALAFSTAALGIVLGFMSRSENHVIVLAVIPVILFLMIICRIGLFKYSSAQRHNGYELHLARLNDLIDMPNSDVQKKLLTKLKETRWEEAVRAWRVVQTNVFKTIYKTPDSIWLERVPVLRWINKIWPGWYHLTPDARDLINGFKQKAQRGKNPVKGYPWFMPGLLATVVNGKNTRKSYHAGMYLENMISILLIMQYLLLTPIGILIFWKINKSGFFAAIPLLILFTLLFIIILLRQIRIHRRRDILENELLSIHSCGIIWHAVIIAHHLALKKMNGHEHYTEELTGLANNLSKNFGTIHQWISDGMSKL